MVMRSVSDYDYTPSEALAPDPAPRAAPYTVISVDDHLVEPPWLFDGRLPNMSIGTANGASCDAGLSDSVMRVFASYSAHRQAARRSRSTP